MSPQSSKTNSDRKSEFFILLALTFLAIFFFRNSNLDFWAARHFYYPENLNDLWPKQNDMPWIFFYHAAPWLTGILMACSLGILIRALFKPEWRKFKKYSAFIFLVIALGPGLFVNSIFKPYWGRPRPREVIELGGHQNYREFYKPDFGGPGKSFPCGHCSVGFAYGLLYWLLKKKKPKTAVAIGLASVAFGLAMGVGRIAAGGHFFSDVIFAGLIVYWVCYWLYYFGLNIPKREEQEESKNSIETKSENKKLLGGIYAGLAALTAASLLLASPFNKEILVDGSSQSLSKLKLTIDQANLDLILDSSLSSSFKIEGDAKGFGFPSNKLLIVCSEKNSEKTCELRKSGLFSDFESNLKVRLNPTLVGAFELNLKKGEIFRANEIQLPVNFQINR